MTQTIVVTGARAPVALHICRLLHASGHRTILADSLRWPLARATTCKAGYEPLPRPADGLDAYAAAWSRLCQEWAPDLVIPTCEEVFYLAAVRDLAGVPIPLFAPPLARLAQVHDKYAFASLAAGFGADPPPTTLLRDAAAIADLPATSLVLKPVWSRFGARTLVHPTPKQRAALRPTQADPWVAQTYLPGEELCANAVAVDGVTTALQAYRPLWRAGLGAGVAFAPVKDTVVERFVTGFCARMRWTGQIAFDFRRDGEGALHAIECNPRPTSGVHFFGPADGFADALAGRGTAVASGTGPMTLPLAMATYGLWQAIRGGALRQWAHDAAAMADIAVWPGDGHLIGAQVRALAEIAWIAARRRQGLRAAATEDIEWNGGNFRR